MENFLKYVLWFTANVKLNTVLPYTTENIFIFYSEKLNIKIELFVSINKKIYMQHRFFK